MTKWEIARYLIDAKKEVDSLWYIAVNISSISVDIDKKYIVNQHRNNFYVNAATIVDKFAETKERGYKKNLKETNELIYKLFYFRDKHSAHKDDNFRDGEFNSLIEIVHECILILREVKIVCKDILPENITLDFVCYDRLLFRYIYGITKETEEKIKKSKYLCREGTSSYGAYQSIKIFNDTEDIWKVENKKDWCVVFNNGLTIEEGLQNRQDSCIKTNVLYNTNMWVSINKEEYRFNIMMIKLGYKDIFERFKNLIKSEIEYEHDIKLATEASKYLVYDLHIDEQIIKKSLSEI